MEDMTVEEVPTHDQVGGQVLKVSDRALRHIAGIRASEPDGDQLALWVEVTGENRANYAYDLWFEPLDEVRPGDVQEPHGDLTVVVPADSVELLRGATLDMNRNLLEGGLVIDNPNRPTPRVPAMAASPAMAGPPPDLSGDLAQRVVQVLEQQINPSIASHGGRADLVAVEDDTAYLRLSGGCQGCGMAAVTLGQGIEVALTQSVPEVRKVVDVTDHASGSNPYYEAAKK